MSAPHSNIFPPLTPFYHSFLRPVGRAHANEASYSPRSCKQNSEDYQSLPPSERETSRPGDSVLCKFINMTVRRRLLRSCATRLTAASQGLSAGAREVVRARVSVRAPSRRHRGLVIIRSSAEIFINLRASSSGVHRSTRDIINPSQTCYRASAVVNCGSIPLLHRSKNGNVFFLLKEKIFPF